MNPVLLKELRSMLRERRGWVVPMAYAAVVSAAAAVFLFPSVLGSGESLRGFGNVVVGTVAVLQTIAVLIFGPLVGAATIAGERERNTWFSLLASPVPRRQIATAKLAVACLYVLVLSAVTVPVAAIGLVLGAADLPTLLGLYTTQAILGCTLTCLGVAASTLFQRTWTAALVAIAGAFAAVVFTSALYASLASLFDEVPEILNWIWYFNPGYSLFLFFAADADMGSQIDWIAHYGAMLFFAGLAAAFTVARLQRIRV